MLRIFFDILGLIFIIAGIFIFPLPIPIGAILIVVGSVILIMTDERARVFVRRTRARSRRFDEIMRSAQIRAPRWIAREIKRTAPQGDRQ